MMLRAYRQIDRLAPGRRSFRTLWSFTAGAAWATLSRAAFASAAGSTTGPATFSRSAGPTSAARPAAHPLDLLRKLGQFFTVEFAIAIGVELHGMLDEPLWRRWPARPTTTRPHAALTAARPGSALTGPARPLALTDATRSFK